MATVPSRMLPPRLQDIAPELVEELQRLLTDEGRPELADQSAELVVVDRRRCGDDFCASFYTAPPCGPLGPDHYTIALSPKEGMLNVDVVGARIVYVEALYRDNLRNEIHTAVP